MKLIVARHQCVLFHRGVELCRGASSARPKAARWRAEYSWHERAFFGEEARLAMSVLTQLLYLQLRRRSHAVDGVLA